MRRAPNLQGSLARLGSSVVTRGGDTVGGLDSAGAGSAPSSGSRVGVSGRSPPVAASAWLSSTVGVMSNVPSGSGSGSAPRPSPLGDPGSWGRGAGTCELSSFRPGCPSRPSMSGDAVLAGSDAVDCCSCSRVASVNSGCSVSPPSDVGSFRPSSLPASLASPLSCGVLSLVSRAPATSAPCFPAPAAPGSVGPAYASSKSSLTGCSWSPSSSSRDIALAGSEGTTVVSSLSSCPRSSRLGGGSLRLSSRLTGASPGSSRGDRCSLPRGGFVCDGTPRMGTRRNTRAKRPSRRPGAVPSEPLSRFRKPRMDIGTGQRTAPVTHGSAKILGQMISAANRDCRRLPRGLLKVRLRKIVGSENGAPSADAAAHSGAAAASRLDGPLSEAAPSGVARRALEAEALAASDNGALLSDDAGRAERAPGNFR